MSDVVRHGTIIIDLKAGKVELDAPSLSDLLGQKKKEAEAQNTYNNTLNETNIRLTNLTKIHQNYTVTINKTIQATREASFVQSRAFSEAAEGAHRMTRSMVLLGVQSEESLTGMVKRLAAVQSGIDLFKGSTQTIRGLAAAFTGSEAAAGALLTKLNPYLAAASAMATAYGLWTDATNRQADAERQLADSLKAQQAARDKAKAGLHNELQRARELEMKAATPGRQEEILEMIQAEKRARVNFLEGLNNKNPFAFDPNPSPRNAWFYNMSPSQREARIEAARNSLTEATQELDQFRKGMVEESRRQMEKQHAELTGVWGAVLNKLIEQGKEMGVFSQALRALGQ